MKLFYNAIVFGILLLTLSTCKKYPDGGFVNQTRMHLFGGHKVGDSKTWKLKLYEVNGIDSTYLIQGAGSIPDFYEKFVTFKLTDSKYICSEAQTYVNTYSSCIDKSNKQITFGEAYDLSNYDSTQCKIINNVRYCGRNIFRPEIKIRSILWNIEKLTKKELIISIKITQSYKIILSQ
ncbi:MAG: hypothetical protein V4506_09700 [Bacteroidota bacterium]